MQKDFWKWHAEKNRLQDSKSTALFYEREVWWCALGRNIGFEQDGDQESFTRPVVVLSKFNLDTCLIIPLTGQPKTGRYYFPIGTVADRDETAVLSQIRYIDRKRLVMKIATLDRMLFDSLLKAVVSACFPEVLK